MRAATLRGRVWTLLVLLLVVVVAAGVLIGQATATLQSATEQLDQQLRPAASAAQAMLAALVDEETGVRGYVITGDDAYLTPYRDGQAAEQRALGRLLMVLPKGFGARQQARDLSEAAERWRTSYADVEIATRQKIGLEATAALVAAGRNKAAFDDLRDRGARLQDRIDEMAAAASDRQTASLQNLRQTQYATLAALVLFTVVAAELLRRWVLTPVRTLDTEVNRVAAGRPGAVVTPHGPRELARLGVNVEGMRRRLVEEVEGARAAEEGLLQRGPVVVGLRSALAPFQQRLPSAVRVAGTIRPAEGVLAGDWFDAVVLSPTQVAIAVVDVSGHGPLAGLLAVRLKETLTAALRAGLDPAAALGLAAEAVGDEERFATGVVAVVDVRDATLTWANGGHPPALLLPRTGPVCGPVTELGPTGPLLACGLGGKWQSQRVPIDANQVLLAFTDGVVEARAADGSELGVDGVVAGLARLGHRPAQTCVEACHALVAAHAVDQRRDDVTVVALELTGQ